MAYLTREQVFHAQDRKFLDVEVPEWGGTVRVGEMTGAQRDSYEMEVARQDDTKTDEMNLRAALVARCVVDQNGYPIFRPDDVKALGMKSAKALARVFKVAVKLNAMDPDSKEEAIKNSESGTPDGPRSA